MTVITDTIGEIPRMHSFGFKTARLPFREWICDVDPAILPH